MSVNQVSGYAPNAVRFRGKDEQDGGFGFGVPIATTVVGAGVTALTPLGKKAPELSNFQAGDTFTKTTKDFTPEQMAHANVIKDYLEKQPAGTPAAPTAPAATPATPVAPAVKTPTALEVANERFETQKIAYDNAKESLALEKRLSARMQEVYNDTVTYPGQDRIPLADGETIDGLKKGRTRLEELIKEKQTSLEFDTNLDETGKKKLEGIIQAKKDEIKVIDSKTLTPDEFEAKYKENLRIQAGEDAKKATEATKKANEAVSTAQNSVTKAQTELEAAQKEGSGKSAEEITKLQETLNKAKAEHTAAVHQHTLSEAEAKFHSELEASLKEESDIRFNTLYNSQMAKAHVDANGKVTGSAVDAVAKARENAGTALVAREEIITNATQVAEKEAKLAEQEAKLRTALGEPAKAVATAGTETGKAVTGAVDAAGKEAGKAAEVAKKELPEAVEKALKGLSHFSAGKIAIGAGIGLAVGAIYSFMTSGSKSDNA